jgi:hypothetical protein
VNLSLGIYDLFANTVPGALYLVIGIHLTLRFGWVSADDLGGLDSTVAVLGAILASYLLGQVVGSRLRWLVDRTGLWGTSTAAVRAEFRRRNPSVAHRPFIDADPFTLLAGLRQVSPEAAVEVDRSRATGIMMRAACPAFAIGAAIAAVEAVVRGEPVVLLATVALVALAVGSFREGQTRNRWARSHTYECALWMPDVDERLGMPAPPPSPVD